MLCFIIRDFIEYYIILAGCRALDDVEIKDIKLETLGDAEAAAEGAGLSTWLYQEYKNEEKKKKLPKISLYGEEGE